MKKEMYLPAIGISIYVIVSIVDKFVMNFEDYIYISIMVVALLVTFVGIIKNRKNR